jgi:elongator complex protein 5
MSHTNLDHRRTHNLLLISKLLNQRDTTSPFTLVLDNLEQPAKPLLREYIRRAKLSKTSSVFLSFETFARPKDVDIFVQSFGKKTPDGILRDVRNALIKTESKSASNAQVAMPSVKLTLLKQELSSSLIP